MRTDRQILVLCPDWTQPSGGVRKLYRHVDVLRAGGFRAFIQHQNPEFRCTWFENDTPIAWPGSTWRPEPTDILLVPEQIGWQMAKISPGLCKVLFNQNAYQTFMGRSAEFSVSPYTHPDFLATIVVSEDSRRFIEHVFPGRPVFRIRNSIDTNLFYPGSERRRRIAYMPRKSESDAAQVILLLRCRDALDGFEIARIHQKSEAETAAILRESMIFLSLGRQEGSPMPPLEAMACGCVTVGYDGRGGREYLNDEFGWPIPQDDVVTFAMTVERLIRGLRDDPEPILRKTRLASEFVRERHSPQVEAADILAAWDEIFRLAETRPA